MPELLTDLDSALQRFGLSSFRAGQREVIETVVSGRDTLCVMPTGGGKSLCYQLPALLLPGVALVVSPLIALMKDQEDQLLRLGMRATALHSGIDPAEQRDRLERITRGEYDLVYVAPERFRSSRFLEVIGRTGISLLAVDEAHCISEWGHDFRPDYARLGWFRQQLRMPPTVALTATATDIVRRDIVSQLLLREPAIFIRGFDRPNLHYGVTPAGTKAQKLVRLQETLAESPGSAIVYTTSRKACDEVANFIRERTKRSVVVYHAGMAPEDRKQAQDAFMSGRREVVVATNAFGMGIDKSDIRAVIHYNAPGTLEAYYQEAGRAGRDGKPAICRLLFSTADRIIQEYFIENEYPSPQLVFQVLEFLRTQKTEPIELTRTEIRERMNCESSEMAIGTCLKLLEGAGALERLRPRENMAIIRIHETGPDLTDLVPASARSQRAVLRILEQIVGSKRGQDIYFQPDAIAARLEIERASLLRTLRDLTERLNIEYIPPFRGNATRVLDRTTNPKSLPIDFEQLQQRKQSEYDKLDRVFGYAQGSGCRRAIILAYFGEQMDPCGNCDNCHGNSGGARSTSGSTVPAAAAAPFADDVTREIFRRVLDAVAELRGRFGKTMIAQTLTGSSSKPIQRFGLQKRNCFNQLSGFRQTEVVEILDAFLRIGLAQQEGDRMRPTFAITSKGLSVIQGAESLPENIPLSAALWDKLRHVTGFAPGAARGSQISTTEEPMARPDRREPSARSQIGEATKSAPVAQAGPAWVEENEPDVVHKPAYYWTWRVLDAGFSVRECAAIRGLSPSLVLNHALAARRSGLAVSARPFEACSWDEDSALELEQLRSLEGSSPAAYSD